MGIYPGIERPWSAAEDEQLLSGTRDPGFTLDATEATLAKLAFEWGRSKSALKNRRRWLMWRRNFDEVSHRSRGAA